jgi:hypothetical protein
MPWRMSPELSKKTEEKIKEQNDVRFPENKNAKQGTIETINKDQENYINFGVRFPSKGPVKDVESVTSIVPDSLPEESQPKIEPVSSILETNEKQEKSELEKSNLEETTEKSLNEIDFIISDLFGPEKNEQGMSESVERLGVLITELPELKSLLENPDISDNIKNELSERYDKIKSGFDELLSKSGKEPSFQNQKSLIEAISKRYSEKI